MSGMVTHNRTVHSTAIASPLGGETLGLPDTISVSWQPNNTFTIKPLTGGSIGYGLGNALRCGFDSLYSRVSALYYFCIGKSSNPSIPTHPDSNPATFSDITQKKRRQKEIEQYVLSQNDKDQLPCQPFIVSSIPNSATAIALYDKYAYVAFVSPSFDAYEIDDPATPIWEGSVPWSNKIDDIAVLGNYAYLSEVVADGTKDKLTIMDVSNHSNFRQAGVYTEETFGSIKVTLAVSGKFAYLDDGCNFQIVDISDPSKSRKISSTQFDQLSSVATKIVGNYAYLAHNIGLVIDDASLIIVDVTDPLTPTVKSRYSIPGIQDVAISDSYAYVADYASGLQIINISNLSFPSYVSTFYMKGGAASVALIGNYACVVEADNFDNIRNVQQDTSYHFYIVDITNPKDPTLAGYAFLDTISYTIAALKNYAFIAEHDSLDILNLNCTSHRTISSSKKWVIVGSSIGGTVLLISGVALAYFIIKRKKAHAKKGERRSLIN